MDLKYRTFSNNQSRLNLFNKIIGSSTEILSLSNTTKKPFGIWCDESIPTSDYNIWWKNTKNSQLDKIMSQAKGYLEEYPHLQYIILEYTTKTNIDNLYWYIIVTKELVIRTYQNDADVCKFIRELAIKQDLL